MAVVDGKGAADAGVAQTFPVAWPADGWFEGRYAGRKAFRQLLRQGFAAAARTGASELVLSDPDFADWPLGEHAVVASLSTWVLADGQRKVIMLANHYDEVVRRHARFVQWRVQWSHRIECWRCRESDMHRALPSLLGMPQWAMWRDDSDSYTGLASCDPRTWAAMRGRLDDWLRCSVPSFPVSVLGL